MPCDRKARTILLVCQLLLLPLCLRCQHLFVFLDHFFLDLAFAIHYHQRRGQSFKDIKYHVMLCYVVLCFVILYCAMLCYVMFVVLCYVVLCYVMSCYVILHYVMLCYVVLCYVVS